jgi:hypothetical protein
VGNYLIYWSEVNRNFYKNAIKTNEQWLKALWYPWLKEKRNDKVGITQPRTNMRYSSYLPMFEEL